MGRLQLLCENTVRIPRMRVKTTHGEDHIARRLQEGHTCRWWPRMRKINLWEDYEKATHGEDHLARRLWEDHTFEWRPFIGKITLREYHNAEEGVEDQAFWKINPNGRSTLAEELFEWKIKMRKKPNPLEDLFEWMIKARERPVQIEDQAFWKTNSGLLDDQSEWRIRAHKNLSSPNSFRM